MAIQVRTINTVKKISRDEYLNGHRSTHTQVLKNKKAYNRKSKHKGLGH